MYENMENDWEAEHDARILQQAAVIKGDSSRLERATGYLDKLAEEAKRGKDQILDDLYPSMKEGE